MGIYTEFEYNDYIYVPEAFHPSFYCSKAEVRNNNGKFITRSYPITSLDDEFIEISCDEPLDSAKLVHDPVLVKDSIYQSLKVPGEKLVDFEERKKIDVSHNGDMSLSFNIMGSFSPDESRPPLEKKRSSLISLNVDAYPKSDSKTATEPACRGFLDLSVYHSSIRGCVTDNFISSDGYIEICMDMEDMECYSGAIEAESPMKQLKFRCNQIIDCPNDDKALLEKERILMLQTSSSESMEMPSLPCKSKGQDSKASPKAHFSPFRKIVEPFIKSKSQQSSPVSASEPKDVATNGMANGRRKRTLHRFLLSDFLNIEHRTESGCRVVEDHSSVVTSSPTLLVGLLKLKFEHGVPFFEFSMKDPENVLAAKIWKTGDSFNWVYTFHSLDITRSDNGSGAKERKKEYSIIGQMQVSCHLCSKMRRNGTSGYSMVAEFVLYDVAHARKDMCTQESSYCSTNSTNPTNGSSGQSLVKGDTPCKLNPVSNLLNYKIQLGDISEDDDSDALNNLPRATSLLHRYLEIAAVAIEVPFEDGESTTEKQGNKFGIDRFFGSSYISAVNWKKKDVINCINPANVKVVTSSGIHGMPSTDDSMGPSSLLDRWRSGGGCDCGGWDMACPLAVFDCPSDQNIEQKPFVESSRPLELFVQGLKEKKPAISVEVIDEGLYSVKFHSQLSMLQAFSISVAIVHGSEICSLVGKERDGQGWHCNSPKLLLEEEANFFVDAIAGEKKKVGNITEEVTQSFLLNPPFSPIARL